MVGAPAKPRPTAAQAKTGPRALQDLEIKYRPVDKLTPFARNARTHSDSQIELICNSMREYGWTNPVLIDEKGVIIAGHGRAIAAGKLGIKRIPTITLKGLTKSQRRAYVLADNKTALGSGWNEELLRLELGELKDAGFNLALTGFSSLEIKDLLNEDEDAESGTIETNNCPTCGRFLAAPARKSKKRK